MYQSSFQNPNVQQRFGQQVPSQYRGFQKPFQPTGPVQSFYQPQQASPFGQSGAGAFHTSAYRGNQPNHDAYLRADSTSAGAVQPQSYQTAAYRGNQPNHDAYLRADSTSAGSVQPQSYQTAAYRGNQPNHDASWRSDSTIPSQSSGVRGQAMAGSFVPQSQFRSF